MAKLTEKQKRFCDEYIVDLNGTQAAIRAGYSKKTARVIATENLSKPSIKEYIDKRLAEKEEQLIAKQDEVLKYLTSVMRGESESEVVVVEGTGQGYSSAKKVIKKPDERERTKAAELLGKRYGLFDSKVTLEGEIDTNLHITFDYGDDEDDEEE